MQESWWVEYSLFIAELLTALGLLAWAAGRLAKNAVHGARAKEGRLLVRSLARELGQDPGSLDLGFLPKNEAKAHRKRAKARKKADRPRLFVLDFTGDVRASGAQGLAKEVNNLLGFAMPGDQVLVRLESPGGAVTGYGLAASQLLRIKARGLPLTVAVDKVAASGGYLMAAVADRILAAPFAVIGSIGVVASLPNFRRLLEDQKVDFEQITAGEYKRTLTLFGENTEKGRAKVQEEVDQVHRLFKDWVARFRPQMILSQVATGEWWHGAAALDLGLIDQVLTSDEFLTQQAQDLKVVGLKWQEPKARAGFWGRMASSLGAISVPT
ncbi:MAG: protease SohB [Candidatus Lambdaproteobacteria bacterium RIFOXYD1_FULL_56_27]|uniref:Protease SohB n=1 Tax=Candidatus Lambdaproteobacteria bacterium RIFOXYD2_FULL_56_26 TaxID=1817773 RepID=A0A1F6H2B7_9PROT|nr:MAG: protease SohB [Candidatus Lambdaproteobacteria bacterium RIFOXYC1_FULL_56_13]OGH04533.1 MAG: protease SohB [Candidatus Lambdaproteobacteria bacterium RIFOXYD2_FULL_56_26]OGH07036.1 MAG: protease SohB [Candidatus Lambdaproteobacteria bacterium RIFOXYD1_FULL_56_27]